MLTPHPGEMARLLDCDISEVQTDPITIAQTFAREHQVTLVLKSVPAVIAGAEGEVWVNTTGNAGMATAGSGDVLTGLIAGLMAQGLTPLDAAIAGVYVHGAAGDSAARTLGLHGLLAGDLLHAVPQTLKDLVE